MGNIFQPKHAWPPNHSQSYLNPSNIAHQFIWSSGAGSIKSSVCSTSEHMMNMQSIMNASDTAGYVDVILQNSTTAIQMYLNTGQVQVCDCSSVGGDNTTIPVIIFGVE